jgi:hypothetical protein
MALTRDFKETVKARAERDAAFREALLTEAVEQLIAGEVEVGKAVLRDYITRPSDLSSWRKRQERLPRA